MQLRVIYQSLAWITVSHLMCKTDTNKEGCVSDRTPLRAQGGIAMILVVNERTLASLLKV